MHRLAPDAGVGVSRVDRENPRERAFAETWAQYNSKGGLSNGRPLIDLLGSNYGPAQHMTELGFVIELPLRRRERALVATSIQWLGSNCGMSFLGDVIRACPKVADGLYRDVAWYKKEQHRQTVSELSLKLQHERAISAERFKELQELTKQVEKLTAEVALLRSKLHPPSVVLSNRKVTIA